MIAACCGAVGVLAVLAAIRPRPTPRTMAPTRPSARRVRRAMPAPGLRRRGSVIQAADVATWCEGLARAVRGGSTLVGAVRTVDTPPSLRTDVDRIVLALDRGTRASEALAISSSSPHLGLAITVLRACAVNGGPPAEPQSAQARLSAVVMTVLPVAMLALLLATSASTRAAAAGGPGIMAITVGGILNLAGWRWMRRIVGRTTA